MRQRNCAFLTGLACLTAAVVGIVMTSTGSAARPAEDDVSKFMRAKLAASQSVLEGIVTEDFDMVKSGADKMLVMSKATEWHVIQGPVYAQYSAEFRRNADDLAKAAQEKNIDAVGLRYVSLTMSCISCHKFVRGTKVAAGEPLSPGFQLALQDPFPEAKP